jgi:hypothetical protein
MSTYRRKAHTRVVNGKTVRVGTSKPISSRSGLSGFALAAYRAERDEREAEQPKTDWSREEVEPESPLTVEPWRPIRLGDDNTGSPVRSSDQWAALDAMKRGGVPAILTLTEDHEGGWSAGDQLCQAHGTGYSPGCMTCRRIAGLMP